MSHVEEFRGAAINNEPRVNERIHVDQVRLVGPGGEQVGVVRVEDALRLAQESGLDLVEVAPNSNPPVAKLMDYGKFKYESAQKAREARRNQTNTVIKSIRIGLKIDENDYNTKKGQAERFLNGGDKVKFDLRFKGREQSRPDQGVRLLRGLAEELSEISTIEAAPRAEGRNMSMVLAPLRKKSEAKSDQRRRREEALRAQRRSLHTMLDNLPGMIYRGQNDKHWTMEFVSEGCFELTGYTPLELVDNQSASFAELIHPEDRDFVWNYVQMRLARRERYELSYRIIDRDGQTRWVWEQGRGIHSSRGEFLGLEGFITDVSSRHEAQEESRRRLFFDNAAGLLGFSLFLDRLQHVVAHSAIAGYPFALIHLEIDALESLAASYGPAMAERVMVETGKRLRVVHGDCNGATRHGNGFAVLITDFRPATLAWAGPAASGGVGDLAAALAGLVERPLRIDGHAIKLQARIGLAPAPSTCTDASALLAEALRAA